MDKPEHSLIIKYLRSQTSEEESKQIKTWMESSSESKEEFENIKSTWEAFGDVESTYQPDMQRAWNNIEEGIDPGRLSIGRWAYRVAAVLLIGVGVGYFMMNKNDGSESGQFLALTEISAQDSIREVTLPDGSVISLNVGASIAYDENFGIDDRKVKLTGEAFFDIQRDEQRPFSIESDATTTRVLGTSFLISPTGDEIAVNVVTGVVSLSSDQGEAVRLVAGERGRYSKSDGSVTKSTNNDKNFLSWKTGELTFDNASIAQVIHDIERHYRIAFRIENETTLKLTASFSNQPLEEVLEVVSATLDLNIEEINSTDYVIQ